MNVDERGRLLIVEPAPSTLHLYSDRLSRAGFKVEEVSEASDALRRIESKHFDFLINDLRMPDGLELLRHLHQRSAGVQTVLLLDSPDNQVIVEAAELGVFQCLIKPIKPDLLVAALVVARRNLLSPQTPGSPRTARVAPNKAGSFTATEAKNKFGQILEKALHGDVVVITKHDAEKAVLISMEAFEALSRAPESRIDTLSAEFDTLLARMQGPAARQAMHLAFHASPKQLGKAAVAAARKRV
jgi:antitoxin Phd